MNTPIYKINKMENVERNNYNYNNEQNKSNPLTNAIIPIEKQQIMIPLNLKNDICNNNNNIRNILKPFNENPNNISLWKHPKFQNPRIFSSRKKSTNNIQDKNIKNTILNNPNLQEKLSICNKPITTMEIFSNSAKKLNVYNNIRYKKEPNSYNSFETHLDENDNRMNQLYFENNLYSKFKEIETNSTCSTHKSDQIENFDYSINNIKRNKYVGNNPFILNFPEERRYKIENRVNYQEKQISNNISDIKNSSDAFNEFHSNIRPVINYNTINIIQRNKYNSIPNIYRNVDNDLSQNYEDQINNITKKGSVLMNNQKIETFPDFNSLINTNLKNSNLSIISQPNQDSLKIVNSISKKKPNETDIILNNTTNISDIIEQSAKEQINAINDEIPLNGSLKKGKKKTMGACFFNLHYLSCQFLMTCDKT